MSNYDIMEKLQEATDFLENARREADDLFGSIEALAVSCGDIECELDDIEYSIPEASDFDPDDAINAVALEDCLKDLSPEKAEEVEQRIDDAVRLAAEEMETALENCTGDLKDRIHGLSGQASDANSAASDLQSEFDEVTAGIGAAEAVLKEIVEAVKADGLTVATELVAAKARVDELEAQNKSLREQLTQERARYRRIAYA